MDSTTSTSYQLLNFAKGPFFGARPGIAEGTHFASYAELRASGMHNRARSGIAGRQAEGVESIVLNGKYNDVDFGNTIVYTGCGGLSTNGQQQIGSQTMDRPEHKAFLLSLANRKPVRVIRGYKLQSKYAPNSGYRYDGLYQVTEAKEETAANGLVECRFRLEKITRPVLAPGSVYDDEIEEVLSNAGTEEDPIVLE